MATPYCPEWFRDVLHAPNGYAGKVHLNERFFYAALVLGSLSQLLSLSLQQTIQRFLHAATG